MSGILSGTMFSSKPSLTEPELEAAFASYMGGSEYVETLGGFVKDKVLEDLHRDEVRERIWNLETEIVARLAAQVEAAINAEKSKPTATRRIYFAGQRRFMEFCSDRGVPHLPASPGAIAGFILAELDRGASLHVIEQRISAIKAMHRDKNHLAPMKDRLVSVVLDYVRKQFKQKGEQENGEQG